MMKKTTLITACNFLILLMLLTSCVPSSSGDNESKKSSGGSASSFSQSHLSVTSAAASSASSSAQSHVSQSKAGVSSTKSVLTSRVVNVVPDFPVSTNKKISGNAPSLKLRSTCFFNREKCQDLLVDLPASWSVKKSSANVFTILCNQVKIGKLIANEMWEANGKLEVLSSSEANSVTLQKRKYTYENGQVSFTYCIITFDALYNYYRIEFDANKISDSSVQQMAASTRINPKISIKNGSLLNKNQTKANILILGNSFVASSLIGETLQYMTDETNRQIFVEAQSRGYYSVSLYAEDIDLMSRIRSGAYDVIFLCGFYSYGDSDAMTDFLSACESGGAKLVMTPAHNETDSVIQTSFIKNKGVSLANWKAFINRLIDSGTSSAYFCIDDSYKHTNIIGGYAGACLLYFMLFDEKPPSIYQKILQYHPEASYYIPDPAKAAAVFQQIEKAVSEMNTAITPTYQVG